MTYYTMSEAVERYPEIEILALVGGGTGTNGSYKLEVCDYRPIASYADVIACRVRDKNNKLIERFNIKQGEIV